MADILIYSSAICPYCVAAKNFLKSKGLDYREVRIDLDASGRSACRCRRFSSMARMSAVSMTW